MQPALRLPSKKVDADGDDDMDSSSDDEPKVVAKGYKVKEPEEFWGKRSKLDSWIVQCERYFRAKKTIGPRDKVMFATTYFRGKAEDWIKPMTKDFLAGESDPGTNNFFDNWNVFKREINRIFGIANEEKIAERRIQELKQTKAAADYAAEFQRWARRTGWNDGALQHMYRRGLKEEVKDEVMRDGRRINTIEDLFEVSIDWDDKLYERRMEKQPRSRKQWRPRNKNQAAAYDPMELDATKQVKPKWKKPKNGIKCYQCGKIGHIKRNCRQNQQNGPPQQHLRAAVHVTKEDLSQRMQRPGTPMPVQLKKGAQDDTPTEVSPPDTPTEGSDDEANTTESEETSNRIMFKMQHHFIVLRLNETPDIDWDETAIRNTTQYAKFSKKEFIDELDRNVFDIGGIPEAWENTTHQNPAYGNTTPGTISIANAPEAVVEAMTKEPTREELKKHENDIVGWNPLNQRIQKRIEDDDWRQEHSHLKDPRSQYENDPRHPHHGKLHFTGCGDDGCRIHANAKMNEDYYPKELRKCFRRSWNSCPEDKCAKHLIDKRYHRVFPGPGHQRLARQRMLLDEGRLIQDCEQGTWQACIVHACEKHYDVKRYHGFHPDDFFYGQNVHLLEESGKAKGPASGADARC